MISQSFNTFTRNPSLTINVRAEKFFCHTIVKFDILNRLSGNMAENVEGDLAVKPQQLIGGINGM